MCTIRYLLRVYIYTHKNIYINIYICMYVCMYICLYVCVCVTFIPFTYGGIFGLYTSKPNWEDSDNCGRVLLLMV